MGGSSGKYGAQQRFSAPTSSPMSSVRQNRYDILSGDSSPGSPYTLAREARPARSRGSLATLVRSGPRGQRARAHLVEVAAPVAGRDHHAPSRAAGLRGRFRGRSGWPKAPSPGSCPAPGSSRSSRPSSACRSRSRLRRASGRSRAAARSRASSSTRSCVWFRMNPAGTRKIRCTASPVQSNVEISGFFLSSRATRLASRSPARARPARRSAAR